MNSRAPGAAGGQSEPLPPPPNELSGAGGRPSGSKGLSQCSIKVERQLVYGGASHKLA